MGQAVAARLPWRAVPLTAWLCRAAGRSHCRWSTAGRSVSPDA
ncbi:integral membrane domain protein [Mycobacterium kansasii]|uniref:Integral membrane domain protein n=1 Tax=Mycobacterium kansasii TaxID=1768 RepID=A0A1V3X8Z5_MYCKA|nr:integral membrane domain protein [Mycobacterium kansasii]